MIATLIFMHISLNYCLHAHSSHCSTTNALWVSPHLYPDHCQLVPTPCRTHQWQHTQLSDRGDGSVHQYHLDLPDYTDAHQCRSSPSLLFLQVQGECFHHWAWTLYSFLLRQLWGNRYVTDLNEFKAGYCLDCNVYTTQERRGKKQVGSLLDMHISMLTLQQFQ